MKQSIKRLIKPATEFLAEILVTFARVSGRSAAFLLYFSQWRLATPEWFDGRLPQLSPARWNNDLNHIIYANVLDVLPMGGRLLDICSGDAFIPYYVYSLRADAIVCVDYDQSAADHAKRFHAKAGIKYFNKSIFDFQDEKDSFDVIVIRGAIEHFSQEKQQKIFFMAKSLLKPGGYFCGDTPAKNSMVDKLLESHEYEWRDESEMRQELEKVFEKIETKIYVSREPIDRVTLRTSLIWRCRK